MTARAVARRDGPGRATIHDGQPGGDRVQLRFVRSRGVLAVEMVSETWAPLGEVPLGEVLGALGITLADCRRALGPADR